MAPQHLKKKLYFFCVCWVDATFNVVPNSTSKNLDIGYLTFYHHRSLGTLPPLSPKN